MISFSSAQLDLWIASFMFPLARVLALMATAPVFSNASLPPQIRLVIGLAVGLGLAPVLPQMPPISPGSWLGIAVLAQQVLIGVVLGFTLRIVFTAVDIAGELIGLQMGLSFATFYDPQSGAQTPVVSEFLGLLTTLLFLAMNGHLLTLSVLGESFRLLPVTATPFAAKGFALLLAVGDTVLGGFDAGAADYHRIADRQHRLGRAGASGAVAEYFAVGFPVTIVAGFTVLMLSLPYFGTALEKLYERGFVALAGVLRAAGGLP